MCCRRIDCCTAALLHCAALSYTVLRNARIKTNNKRISILLAIVRYQQEKDQYFLLAAATCQQEVPASLGVCRIDFGGGKGRSLSANCC